MPRNIELKARDPDPARSLRVSVELGAEDRGWLRQLDTYFRVAHGRLKLHEHDMRAELIYYERSDEAIEGESNGSRVRQLVIVSPRSASAMSSPTTGFDSRSCHSSEALVGGRCGLCVSEMTPEARPWRSWPSSWPTGICW
jgi:hypothetical protein